VSDLHFGDSSFKPRPEQRLPSLCRESSITLGNAHFLSHSTSPFIIILLLDAINLWSERSSNLGRILAIPTGDIRDFPQFPGICEDITSIKPHPLPSTFSQIYQSSYYIITVKTQINKNFRISRFSSFAYRPVF
jgi:hypothetical protein